MNLKFENGFILKEVELNDIKTLYYFRFDGDGEYIEEGEGYLTGLLNRETGKIIYPYKERLHMHTLQELQAFSLKGYNEILCIPEEVGMIESYDNKKSIMCGSLIENILTNRCFEAKCLEITEEEKEEVRKDGYLDYVKENGKYYLIIAYTVNRHHISKHFKFILK